MRLSAVLCDLFAGPAGEDSGLAPVAEGVSAIAATLSQLQSCRDACPGVSAEVTPIIDALQCVYNLFSRMLPEQSEAKAGNKAIGTPALYRAYHMFSACCLDSNPNALVSVPVLACAGEGAYPVAFAGREASTATGLFIPLECGHNGPWPEDATATLRAALQEVGLAPA